MDNLRTFSGAVRLTREVYLFSYTFMLWYYQCDSKTKCSRTKHRRNQVNSLELKKDSFKSSGVTVKDECVAKYQEIKMGKQYSYVIFKISSDLKTIVVDCCGEKGATYEEFKSKMIAAGQCGEGRYGVFDVQTSNKGVLAFFTWCPDNGLPIKQKMLYTSSKKELTKKLEGLGVDIQCNDEDDLEFGCISEKCQSRYK